MDTNIKTAKNSAIKIKISKGSCRPPYWTQQCAILNKISECLPTVTPQQSLKDFSLSSVLPGSRSPEICCNPHSTQVLK